MYHGEIPYMDEYLSHTLENFIVLTWLRLVNPGLPALVKQRYGTELRSQTLSSIKPEISQTFDSLLEEIHASAETKVLRTVIRKPNINVFQSEPKHAVKSRLSCPLCKQEGRPAQQFLSKCKYLPQTNKLYFCKIRQATDLHEDDIDSDDLTDVISSKDSAIDVHDLPTQSSCCVHITTSKHEAIATDENVL